LLIKVGISSTAAFSELFSKIAFAFIFFIDYRPLIE
jgi:hypothetical protein